MAGTEPRSSHKGAIAFVARGVLLDVAVPNQRSLGSLAVAMLALVGCDSVIPAHTLSAKLVANGTISTAVLSFPAHDAAAAHHPADSTCTWKTGNCGWDEPTHAIVTGDAPINAAWLTTIGGDIANVAYYVTVRQPGSGDATCILDISLGTVPCDYGRGNLTLTLTPQ
jgi:hypothetical protein